MSGAAMIVEGKLGPHRLFEKVCLEDGIDITTALAPKRHISTHTLKAFEVDICNAERGRKGWHVAG